MKKGKTILVIVLAVVFWPVIFMGAMWFGIRLAHKFGYKLAQVTMEKI